jgi:hypothetical protein
MPGMVTKHKILWFFLDKHNRERYFFICGSKRFGSNSCVIDPQEAGERREFAVLSDPRFPFVARDFPLTPPGWFTPVEARDLPIFSTERIS